MNKNLRQCNDDNPKTVQRELRFQNPTEIIQLCNNCKTDSFYSNFISEVSIHQ